MMMFRSTAGATRLVVRDLWGKAIFGLVVGAFNLMFFIAPDRFSLFDVYKYGPGVPFMRALFLVFTMNCFWLLFGGLYYLAQTRGWLPILIAWRRNGHLVVGGVGAMLTGQGQRIGSEVELRLDATAPGRQWTFWGYRDTFIWTIRTGGMGTSVHTAVELNADVEQHLRESLEGLRSVDDVPPHKR